MSAQTFKHVTEGPRTGLLLMGDAKMAGETYLGVEVRKKPVSCFPEASTKPRNRGLGRPGLRAQGEDTLYVSCWYDM